MLKTCDEQSDVHKKTAPSPTGLDPPSFRSSANVASSLQVLHDFIRFLDRLKREGLKEVSEARWSSDDAGQR